MSANFAHYLKELSVKEEEPPLPPIFAHATETLSRNDLQKIINDPKITALRDGNRTVTKDDFVNAIEKRTRKEPDLFWVDDIL